MRMMDRESLPEPRIQRTESFSTVEVQFGLNFRSHLLDREEPTGKEFDGEHGVGTSLDGAGKLHCDFHNAGRKYLICFDLCELRGPIDTQGITDMAGREEALTVLGGSSQDVGATDVDFFVSSKLSRQNYPLLESLGFRFAGAEDQGVEAGLVDDGLVWVAGGSIHNVDRILFIVIQQGQG